MNSKTGMSLFLFYITRLQQKDKHATHPTLLNVPGNNGLQLILITSLTKLSQSSFLKFPVRMCLFLMMTCVSSPVLTSSKHLLGGHQVLTFCISIPPTLDNQHSILQTVPLFSFLRWHSIQYLLYRLWLGYFSLILLIFRHICLIYDHFLRCSSGHKFIIPIPFSSSYITNTVEFKSRGLYILKLVSTECSGVRFAQIAPKVATS